MVPPPNRQSSFSVESVPYKVRIKATGLDREWNRVQKTKWMTIGVVTVVCLLNVYILTNLGSYWTNTNRGGLMCQCSEIVPNIVVYS